jgi:NADPH-dependent ferric siderophore reductase
MDEEMFRRGLLLISRGFKTCAEAIPTANATELTDAERDLAFARDWRERGGLTQSEAAELCARWGLPGQKISAWVRGEWAEIHDGRRYLTAKAQRWLAQNDPVQDDGAA